MKINYDKEVDALYINLKKGKVASSKPEGDDLVIDLNSKKEILGLEVLNASQYLNKKSGNLEVSIGSKKFSIAK